MALLKLLAYVWFFLMGITFIGIIFGYYVENKIPDNTRLKKWWRKNIVGIDQDEEHFWKNFKG